MKKLYSFTVLNFKNILTAIFILLSIWFILQVDYQEFLSLYTAAPSFIGMLIIFHFFRCIRYKLVLDVYANGVSFRDAAYIYYIGLSLGIVSPGKVGELYRIRMVNQLTANVEKATACFFLDKILDISAIFGFGVFWLLTTYDVRIIFSIIIAVFFQTLFYISLFYTCNYLIVRSNSQETNYFILKNILSVFSYIPPANISTIKLLYISLLSWCLFIMTVFLLVRHAVDIDLQGMLYVFVINSISTSVPVSFLGFGVRELLLGAIPGEAVPIDYVGIFTVAFSAVYLVSFLSGVVAYAWRRLL